LWNAPVDGVVTSLFGARINPVLQTYEAMHNGIDLAADVGTPALAMADGVVTETGESPSYGIFMKYIVSGGYEIMYAHLSKVTAEAGAFVREAAPVALTGDTGLTTGPHLHVAIWKDGVLIDPTNLIRLPE